ncbi:MAG: hypothetical protein ACPGED_12850 [Flavobacteriales bacterium]
MRKIVLSVAFVASVGFTLTSCKKDNFCYACTAQAISSWNMGQQVVREECDLTKSDRDEKADAFEAAYPSESWNTTCVRDSE